MFEKTLAMVTGEASAERAYDHVLSVSQFHRIQASPGFRKAAGYCVDRLLESSPEAQVLHYPAEATAKFWHFPSFDEWVGRRGVLTILSPNHLAGKIADFEDCPISLIQRSRATIQGGVTTEIAYVGDGRKAKDYRGCRGKIVICDSHCVTQVYPAAAKAGVAGILLYKQRPLPPLRKGSGIQGIRQYNSFWWDEKDLFGFVLTPEDGERIVSYLRSLDSKKRRLKAHAIVETETYPGTFEVVTSRIPGRQRKEILVVAHLCHPKPSAGDNASGVAALLEVHRILNALIECKHLARPRYGIRFLLVPEITGTFAYLSREYRISKRLLFGLNLDMVGQNQDMTGATLCVESPPMSAPSFTPYLLEEIVGRAFSQGSNPGDTSSLASIRTKATPFSGGSDHFILSDPTVGVPTPMLIQWPDKFYHTSGDTVDRVSPDVLRRIAITASAYAYTCALASKRDLMWIADMTGRALRKRAVDEMSTYAAKDAGRWISVDYKADFLLKHGKRVLDSVSNLLPHDTALKARIKTQVRVFNQTVRREAAVTTEAMPKAKSSRRRLSEMRGTRMSEIVKRLGPGPIDPGIVLKQVGARWQVRYRRWMASEKKGHMLQMLALYWADGTRTVSEVCRLVAAELGHTNPEFIRFYFDLLEEAGLVEIL
jgi:hypothetical protein